MPRADLILAYATGAGVRPEWILTGKGPRYATVVPDPDDPFVGSLVQFVQGRVADQKSRGVWFGLTRSQISAAYHDALIHHWPIAEIRRLDQWRDQLLKEYNYPEEMRDFGSDPAWSQSMAGDMLSSNTAGEKDALLNSLIDASPEAIKEFLADGLFNPEYLQDEIAKRRAARKASKEPGNVLELLEEVSRSSYSDEVFPTKPSSAE